MAAIAAASTCYVVVDYKGMVTASMEGEGQEDNTHTHLINIPVPFLEPRILPLLDKLRKKHIVITAPGRLVGENLFLEGNYKVNLIRHFKNALPDKNIHVIAENEAWAKGALVRAQNLMYPCLTIQIEEETTVFYHENNEQFNFIDIDQYEGCNGLMFDKIDSFKRSLMVLLQHLGGQLTTVVVGCSGRVVPTGINGVRVIYLGRDVDNRLLKLYGCHLLTKQRNTPD